MSDASLTTSRRPMARAGSRAYLQLIWMQHIAPRSAWPALLCSEVAFFGTLIVAYITFWAISNPAPLRPRSLSLPLVITGTLGAYSEQHHRAFRTRGACALDACSSFRKWLAATVMLGACFSPGRPWNGMD